jgi:hypothetical protein
MSIKIDGHMGRGREGVRFKKFGHKNAISTQK